MIKIALIGDPEIKDYTIADRLWELISVVINKKIKLNIMSINSPTDMATVLEVFKKDSSFVGFNIAQPWTHKLANSINKREDLAGLPLIDTVYRDEGHDIVGANVAPIAVQRSLESVCNLYKHKSVLVIGGNDIGLSIAHHFSRNLDKKSYLFDPLVRYAQKQDNIVFVTSIREVSERKYDLIVNASPLDKHYFNKRVEAFTSPLDLEALQHITHKDTVVQEINYLPSSPLLLQMARHLELQAVTGDSILVFWAMESLKRYLQITLDENTIRMLIEEISSYIADQEAMFLEQG